MAKEMLINVSEGEECRIALVEDGRLEELYMERTSATSHVGNIYKGRVTNVEASIQAAFVDFGLGRNGFLHISDLMPTYFGRAGENVQESVGRKMARHDRPPIQRCLRRGDEIVVQIIKEGIGTKGPTLSTYLSVPGRILVMMPGMGKMGVSKKIEDDAERRRLRQILDQLDPPKDVAFIIRTAGIGKTKADIQRDLKYLTRLWEQIEKLQKEPAPVALYTEGDLVTRTVRDVFTADIDRIVVDSKDVARRVKDVIKITAPRTKNRVDVHEGPVPLFHEYGIERDIEMMYSRHVPLPSGGSLVIDSTEAIVAIDVNSGKFRDHSDAETTAFKTDMEAADEIPRQLKLRDLGGVIICDFIDLRFERHRRELEHRLEENFRRDRAKTKVLRMSQFGIVELTRQRMRPSLKRSIYFDCPHCKGAGLVKTPESMALDVMRRLAIAVNSDRVAHVELAVCNDVAMYLNNKKRQALADLEASSGKRILLRTDVTLSLDEIKMDLFDARDGVVIIPELALQAGAPHSAPPRSGRGGPRRDDRRPPIAPARRLQPPAAKAHEPTDDDEDEHFRTDLVEDEVDRREAGDEDDEIMLLPPTPVGTAAARPIAPAGPAVADDRDDDAEDEHDDQDPQDIPQDIRQADRPADRDNRSGADRPDGRREGGEGSGGRRRRRGRRGRGGSGENEDVDRDNRDNGGPDTASNDRPSDPHSPNRSDDGRQNGGRPRDPREANRQGGGRQGDPRDANRQGGGRQGDPREANRQGGGRQGESRDANRQGGGRQGDPRDANRQGGGRQGDPRDANRQGGGRRGDPRDANRQGGGRPLTAGRPPAAIGGEPNGNLGPSDDIDDLEDGPQPGNQAPDRPADAEEAANGEAPRRRRRRGGRRHRARRERERARLEQGLPPESPVNVGEPRVDKPFEDDHDDDHDDAIAGRIGGSEDPVTVGIDGRDDFVHGSDIEVHDDHDDGVAGRIGGDVASGSRQDRKHDRSDDADDEASGPGMFGHAPAAAKPADEIDAIADELADVSAPDSDESADAEAARNAGNAKSPARGLAKAGRAGRSPRSAKPADEAPDPSDSDDDGRGSRRDTKPAAAKRAGRPAARRSGPASAAKSTLNPAGRASAKPSTAKAADVKSSAVKPATRAESDKPVAPRPPKTGSTDRHHLKDEPGDDAAEVPEAEPEITEHTRAAPPRRRPSSSRDLDAIPDDFD